jgi:hypothetical protein
MSKSSSPPRTWLALPGFIIVTFCAPLFGAAAMPGAWLFAPYLAWVTFAAALMGGYSC